MKLHELKPQKNSKHKKKRLGRGPGSGHGGTSGRGHKGQKSRAGEGVRLGFEGGQMPLIRRIPKRGFTNIFKKEYNVINLKTIQGFDENEEITPEVFKKKGAVKKKLPIKILGDGDITKPFKIKAHAFSKGAKEKIEKAGGTITLLQRTMQTDEKKPDADR